MVKFLGKKVLATLIVMSLVATLTPLTFAATDTPANSTTAVKNYSDLGLTGLTPYYKLTVEDDAGVTEDYTPTRDSEGNVTEKLMPASKYNAKTFGTGSANSRGFNRLSSNNPYKYNNTNAFSSFDGETDDMVVKIYGGPLYAEDGVTISSEHGVVSRAIAMGGIGQGNHPLTESKNGAKQVWEIKIKFSDVTSGSYRLFQAGYNTSDYRGGQNQEPDFTVSTIGIENGEVFVMHAGEYDYNLNGINSRNNMKDVIATGLESGEWYTFVKVLEVDKTRGAYDKSSGGYCSEDGHYEGKVYVFAEDGTCLGGHDDMRDFARYNKGTATKPNSISQIRSLSFIALGLEEDEYVMVDDFKAYTISDASITSDAADAEKTITVTDTSAPLEFVVTNLNVLASDITNNITIKDSEGEALEGYTVAKATNGNIVVALGANAVANETYTLNFDITNPVGKNISEEYKITVASPDFSINSVEFVGSDGIAKVEEIVKDTVVKAKVEMTNGSEEPQEYVIILALYDGTQLKQIIFSEGDAKKGTDFYYTEALTAESAGLDARIFVWDNWTDINPLEGATTLGE